MLEVLTIRRSGREVHRQWQGKLICPEPEEAVEFAAIDLNPSNWAVFG